MEADFRSILTGHTPLIALVPAARIYPDYYPQGSANPAIRISKVDGQTGMHMTGSDGLTSTLMQIDIRTLASGGKGPLNAIVNMLIGAHGVGGLLHPFSGIQGATLFQVISLASDRGAKFEKPETIEYLTASLDFNVRSGAA